MILEKEYYLTYKILNTYSIIHNVPKLYARLVVPVYFLVEHFYSFHWLLNVMSE